MSEQQPWQSPQPPQPQQGWPPPPANPYGYPPPPNPYAAAPQNPYAASPQNPYAAPTYGYPPHTYGYPSPSPYSYGPPPRTHHGRNLLIGGVVVALLVAVVAVAAQHPQASTAVVQPTAPAQTNQANQSNPTQPNPTPPSPGPTSDGVTASSSLSPMSGIEVYSDDFTDSTSGWSTGADPKGADFEYAPDGYTVTSTVAAHWLAYAPYDDPAQQVNLNMTAHESAGAPTGAGFGLVCRRGPDSTADVRYEFVVNESNRWFIERNQGAVSLSSPTPTILDEGALPTKLGTQELEISGICATLADGQTTRLALFIGSQKVADITDVSSLDGDGWLGGLISSGDDVKSTTTVAGYTESDLGNDGILAANT
ncbi:MAG TPA: hypothetical protein VGL75_00355 [Acidothermaceae bacterium]